MCSMSHFHFHATLWTHKIDKFGIKIQLSKDFQKKNVGMHSNTAHDIPPYQNIPFVLRINKYHLDND